MERNEEIGEFIQVPQILLGRSEVELEGVVWLDGIRIRLSLDWEDPMYPWSSLVFAVEESGSPSYSVDLGEVLPPALSGLIEFDFSDLLLALREKDDPNTAEDVVRGLLMWRLAQDCKDLKLVISAVPSGISFELFGDDVLIGDKTMGSQYLTDYLREETVES